MGLYQNMEWGWDFGGLYMQTPATWETQLLGLSPATGGIHIVHVGMYMQTCILTSKRGKWDGIVGAVCVSAEHVCRC